MARAIAPALALPARDVRRPARWGPQHPPSRPRSPAPGPPPAHGRPRPQHVLAAVLPEVGGDDQGEEGTPAGAPARCGTRGPPRRVAHIGTIDPDAARAHVIQARQEVERVVFPLPVLPTMAVVRPGSATNQTPRRWLLGAGYGSRRPRTRPAPPAGDLGRCLGIRRPRPPSPAPSRSAPRRQRRGEP